MYSVDEYFVEIAAESIAGDGWTADAIFSRRADYRGHGRVWKVRYPAHILGPTKAAVEKATVAWARQFIACSSPVLESSLALRKQIASDVEAQSSSASKRNSATSG
ncbi:hypothetical protein AWB77_05949 [Caballeronia fortuita]|uniref:Uncharacterized protein n=1 Tax=Caballeronia fortuita TaxID=1777138 RepID=A0A158DX90_9BURK|nr:hypothetical protein [Caballeronia fortuita]SAK99222.1 hypothetical protein AWB77_05949 [Caballeronia fortuita]